MGKVTENKQQKERSLLDTAFQLFTSKGIAKTSISDIVQQAGMAKGTFYLYFRDKYELQERLIVHKAEVLFRHALGAVQGREHLSSEEQIIALVDDILSEMQRDHRLLRFINKNLSWAVFRRALGKSNMDYLTEVRRILNAGGEQWQEQELMLYTIIELVGSTSYSVILDEDPVDLERYKPWLFRSIRAIMDSHRLRPGQFENGERKRLI
jgi:AcrR family transcriptional regulator